MTELLRLRADLLEQGLESRETHISLVFLSRDHAFKIKKPKDLGFLDFTTLARRRAACQAEVGLNRRLAPGVYEGIVPVVRSATGWHRLDDGDDAGEGAAGEIVEWAVKMRRLPDSDRADVRLAEERLERTYIDELARVVARFHALARADQETARHGTVEAIRRNVEENFEQTRATISEFLSPEAAGEVEAWQLGFLERHAELFALRALSDRVRDGHGDLRLEHVYITDAARPVIAIIDCIEFNDRFRFADVCADIAFLAMDLAWHRQVGLAERFLAAYAQLANDYDLYPLVDFYESYRAFVRGKIASFTAHDEAIELRVRQRAAAEARRYYLLAQASERRSLLPRRLVAVGGSIATGKSTIAGHVAERLAAPSVEADRTRKFLLGVLPEQPLRHAAFSGAYDAQTSERVYAELLRRAAAVLRSGRGVVLDASFRSRTHRAAARRLAAEHGVEFLFIECQASDELCRARLRKRQTERSTSDGRLEILDRFRESFESVVELRAPEHLMLDTGLPLEQSLQQLEQRMALRPPRLEA